MARQPLKPHSSSREPPFDPAEEPLFDALRRYAPELHRYLTKRMREPANVQDLMQEMFERFLRVPKSNPVANTQAYLYRVASNLVREHYEREGRSPVTFDSEALDAAAEEGTHATENDLAAQLALQQDLNRALLKLPPVHRAVLLLVKREGLSYEEVAQKLGLELSTVTKYVFEARARMKMLLKRESGEEGKAP